jgi:hypothetical protein
VNPPLFDSTRTGVIRFTRRIARQCSPGGSGIPDWVVCDAIANGSRRRTGRRGTRGGTVIRFERTFPGGPESAGITVRVLGELTREGCFALQLLFPAGTRRKIWDDSGFFNRSASK